MVFHNVLDILFSTWSHVAVLRVLQGYATGITGREIARVAEMNHRACQKALATLEGIGIVLRQRGGRDHLFSLNRDNVLVHEVVNSLYQFEKSFLKDACSFLSKRLGAMTVSIILFGSVARKQETVKSDFDICVVVSEEKRKETAQVAIEKISREFRKKFGGNLAPFIISKKEFSKRAQRKQSPVATILKEGIVIHGKQLKELMNG